MTTETKSETTEAPVVEKTSENKTVFGPLGKYAAVAVIMVSVIVTTAIMLGKQLNTTDQELAAIENTVAQKFSPEAEVKDEAVAAEVEAPAAIIKEIAETTIVAEPTNEAEVVAIEKSTAEVLTTAVAVEVEAAAAILEETAETSIIAESTNEAKVEVVAIEESTAEVLITAKTSVASETAAIEQPATATDAAQFSLATDSRAEQQTRIEAFKVQQKQRMTEMFARIKTLEAQQLDQYKTSQEGQVVRLREQIAQQNKMIETLILRNKDHYDLRAANIQRVQSNREQMLNRI